MAIHLHRHLNLEALADQFAEALCRRPADLAPLEPEYLVVQTPGMRAWLALETARRNGCFVRIECLTPVQFIMKLGFLALRQREERSVFEKDVLPWALYRFISEGVAAGEPALEALAEWLKAGEEEPALRLFSLAGSIADLFDQYMLSRPDILTAWEDGRRAYPDRIVPEERWQAHLWRKLLECGGDSSNRADFFERLSRGLEESEAAGVWLPKRVFLFGMSLLPARFLAIFDLLSRRIDVELFLQVPSLHYYGDLLSDTTLRRLARRGVDTHKLKLDGGNRILANFGRTGREFMDQVLELCPHEAESELDFFSLPEPATPGRDNLLQHLQDDIRHCRESRDSPKDLVANPDGWTLRVARCPGRLREVEVLKDLLLECFSADPGLSPSDVLVVSTDVAAHAPLVELVFGSGVTLPFSLADIPRTREDRPLRLATDLLAAVGGRFSPAEIVPLFEEACELAGAPLDQRARSALADWCRGSGVRWGLDGSSKAAWELPAEDALTWKDGLKRLFAGYAAGDDEKLGDGTIPFGACAPQAALSLGRLAAFVHELGNLAAERSQSRPLADWIRLVRPTFGRLLGGGQDDDGSDSSRLAPLNAACGDLSARMTLAGLADQPISWELFARRLADELEAPIGPGAFLTGAITVAGMVPMRSLPFKVIAVLGLDQGAFPRQTHRPEYDLMRLEHRPGDRDTLEADRYLFLELLLSARDRLILLSGSLAESGKPGPTSSAVTQLIDWLDREYTLDGKPAGTRASVIYPLQPYSERYLEPVEGTAPLTYATEWFEVRNPAPVPAPLFSWRAPPPPTPTVPLPIDGSEICRALSDPLHAFLGKACRLPLRDRTAEVDDLPDGELFTVDNLGVWQLRDRIFDDMAASQGDAVERLAAAGELPPGAPGRSLVERTRRSLASRISHVRRLAGTDTPVFAIERFLAEREGQSYRHEAVLCRLSAPSGWLSLEAGRLKGKRRLRFWVTHLYANLAGPATTVHVTLDAQVRFRPISDPDWAAARLRELDALTRETAERLLPFFPDASWAFVSAPPDKAFEAAWKTLAAEAGYGSPYNDSPVADPWLARAFASGPGFEAAGISDEFAALARRVYAPYMELCES